MTSKLKPLYHLWILFSLQTVMLMGAVIALMAFQPRITETIAKIQETDMKIPILKQRLEQADPEHVRREAILLLNGDAEQSRFVRSMEMSLIQFVRSVCCLLFIITCWLGIIAFQMQRSN
jgi:hypothetical protein